MNWLRTLLVFDRGNIAHSQDWQDVHTSYVNSINSIDFPEGDGTFTLRRKSRNPSTGKWRRNGVGYLKNRFIQGMVNEGWQSEAQVNIEHLTWQPELRLYPSLESYREPITSSFGDFDFLTETESGLHVAIEWETGNISSTHRSLNKLVIALKAKQIDVGVLILPSRRLYEHLTDRIGNIGEISPYLNFWSSVESTVERGLLAISVVEQDELTDSEDFPYLPSGNDGRAREGRGE